jgi:hypothetical protein
MELPAMRPAKSPSTVYRLLSTAAAVLLFTIYNLLFTAPPVSAANAPDCSAPKVQTAPEIMNQFNNCAIESNIYDDKLFNFNQMSGTVDSIYTMLLGYSALHPQTNAVTDGTGATSVVNGMVASLYSRPPISGTYYVAQKIQNLNPVQPAYAATSPFTGGIGYSILQPVNKIWSAFRDASYVGFLIIFVVIGFMIMFRRKISSQAVATIQDSLPRIVIALILVTFSYAIVGLIIDAMFVLLNVIAALLISAGLTPAGADKIFTDNIFTIIFSTMWGKDGIFASITVAIQEMLSSILGKVDFIGAVGWVGGSLVGIFAAIAVLMVSIRIFLMLLMAYVSLILLTIFAPFILLFEALPGNNSFKEWFKQIVANLSVFPTVAVMIMLAGLISGIGALGGTGNGLIGQEQIGNFPLLSGVFSANSVGKLIGLGLLLMTPSAAKIVKERLGVKDGALGAGAGMAMAGLGAGAVAGRKIGGEIAPHTPYLNRAQDWLAAKQELPKMRRQSKTAEYAMGKGLMVPGYTKPEGK